MQWSNHCVPWQIDFVGVLFGLRPLLCVLFVFLSVLLFPLAKRKSGWGICGSSWFGGLVFFVWLFYLDLPAHMDKVCPCTNVFSTAYAHVRTEPSDIFFPSNAFMASARSLHTFDRSKR